MPGHVTALYRHPVKGFTPERLAAVELRAGAFFPCDRLFAVEDGPSGFDSDAPAWVSKTAFTVLARLAHVARARTAYDEKTGVLVVAADGRPSIRFQLSDEAGRQDFSLWLTDFLGDEARGPLKVVSAAGHHFTDHPEGQVSIINLASVRALAEGLGRPVDPLRFRANLNVDGWPAWAENDAVGRTVRIGEVEAEVFKPIVRCAAPDVDPATGERDMEITKALFDGYGHMHCGIYVKVTRGGRIAEGDPASL